MTEEQEGVNDAICSFFDEIICFYATSAATSPFLFEMEFMSLLFLSKFVKPIIKSCDREIAALHET